MLQPPRRNPESTSGTPRPHTGGQPAAWLCLLALGLFALACTTAPPPPRTAPQPDALWTDAQLAEAEALASSLTEAEPPEDGQIRIRLAFSEGTDLDLFVSDPMQETVYFANDRAKSGGMLHEDRRCGMPAPQIEIVEYTKPLPGRYRIGVDFPRFCDGNESASAVFAIAVEVGPEREIHRGIVGLSIFLPEVARFDHAP